MIWLRRRFLQWIGAAGVLRANVLDGLMSSIEPTGEMESHLRRYSAQAVVLVFNLPILSISRVGGGYALLESQPCDSGRAIALQFAAGSDPSRAKGLNRCGYFREIVVLPAKGPLTGGYFGFMTSSPEKSLDQARKSIDGGSKEQAAYRVIEGLTTGSKAHTGQRTVMAPGNLGWKQIAELYRRCRAAAGAPAVNTGVPEGATTFLYAIRETILDPAAMASRNIVYNGKLYRMTTAKESDHGRVRVSGTMIDSTNGEKSLFRFWYEPGVANIVPVKIEYKARSFLRLVFEHQKDLEGPEIASVLRQAPRP